MDAGPTRFGSGATPTFSTLPYKEFPPEHWRQIRTNNGIEHINRDIRRRTRAVGTFPDGNSTSCR